MYGVSRNTQNKDVILEYDRIAYVDGACGPPNPGGPGGWGVHMTYGDTVVDKYGHLDACADMTNNVAEYHAALVAIALCMRDGFTGSLLVRADSQLVVQQMKGNWTVKKGGYVPTYQKLKLLVDAAPFTIEWEWIPREQNQQADALSKKGLKNQS